MLGMIFCVSVGCWICMAFSGCAIMWFGLGKQRAGTERPASALTRPSLVPQTYLLLPGCPSAVWFRVADCEARPQGQIHLDQLAWKVSGSVGVATSFPSSDQFNILVLFKLGRVMCWKLKGAGGEMRKSTAAVSEIARREHAPAPHTIHRQAQT